MLSRFRVRIVADVTKDHDDRKVVQYALVPSDVFAACRAYPVISYWGQLEQWEPSYG